MHYDFIEIGTSDFDTLVASADEHAFGICVEPVKYYLDRLPRKPNVRYVCCAIADSEGPAETDVYWVHPDDIERLSLPYWLRGCNSIGAPHPRHFDRDIIPPLLKRDRITMMSMCRLFEENGVTSVGQLKLDTEGMDCWILLAMARCPNLCHPQSIFFETNLLTPQADVDRVRSVYEALGYSFSNQGENSLLIKNSA
jgi:hypothetical protein